MTVALSVLSIFIYLLLQLPSDPVQAFITEKLPDMAIITDSVAYINYFVPLNIIMPMFYAWLCCLPVIVVVMIIVKFVL